MNKELLEKMNYLYSVGFEPDMWYSSTDGGMTFALFYYQQLDDDQPYFTESRLWSLLKRLKIHIPNFLCIEAREYDNEDVKYYLANGFTEQDLIEMSAEIREDSDFYLDFLGDNIGFYSYYPDGIKNILHEIKHDIDNLHTGLLDLTIWTVREGHLKANKILDGK